jgi:hypothetical protein
MASTFLAEVVNTRASDSSPFPPGFLYFRAPLALVALFLGSRIQQRISSGLILAAVIAFCLEVRAARQDTDPRLQRMYLRREERAADSRKALAVARDLAHYDDLRRSFRLEDAHLEYVKSRPESLFVKLGSTTRRTIDAAWWWNPVSGGTPSLSWHDFLAACTSAERIAAKHPWLSELKSLPGKRSLELHLIGTGVAAAEGDLATYLLPPWQHAGMRGRPTYRFLARRGNHSWVEFVFSDDDDRAFVRSTSVQDPNPQSPLDSLDVSWHPRDKRGQSFSQYAVVEPDGRVTVQSYVMKER